MSFTTRTAALAGLAGLALPAAVTTTSASAATVPTNKAAAVKAGNWLARQFKGSYIPASTGKGADYSSTAQAVQALLAVGGHAALAKSATEYLSKHVPAEIAISGTKMSSPGSIAFLILDAKGVGLNPAKFGGSNLIGKLLGTMRTKAPDKGLFGRESATYDGAYRQGLALAALAKAGVAKSKYTSAVNWLEHQQCANSAWEAFRSNTAKACPPTSSTSYSGPDTNSTALAVIGLKAAGATVKGSPFAWYKKIESSSGGWGYYGGAADPDSTGLSINALVALNRAGNAGLNRKGKTPLQVETGFQLPSGAFTYSLSPKSANLLATIQAIPALVGQSYV